MPTTFQPASGLLPGGGGLPDDALVVRGGQCTSESLASGSGVTTGAAGNLQNLSVNSFPGMSVADLSTTFPHKQVGVTTVGHIRGAGGNVTPDPLPDNPYHALVSDIDAQTLSDLLRPTIRNPNRP